jgi:hypothetical protein
MATSTEHQASLMSFIDEVETHTYSLDHRMTRNPFAIVGLKKTVKSFAPHDLVRLIHAAVEYENELGHWGMGSASQVHVLIEVLRESNPILAAETAGWAFRSTNNPYIPFGTAGRYRNVATSVDEYHKLVSASEHRQNQVEEKELIKKNERRAEADRRHQIRTQKQKENCDLRNLYLSSLKTESVTEMLTIIANDSERSPYFYPEKFIDDGRDILDELNIDLKQTLLKKLQYPPRGKWRQLAVRLRHDLSRGRTTLNRP